VTGPSGRVSPSHALCSFVPLGHSGFFSQYPVCFWAAIFILPHPPSCTPNLYPHNPPPLLLLIQHNIIRTIHTKHARTRRYSHTLSYCITQSFTSRFSCPISICALLFLSFPFPFFFIFLSFCLYAISIRCSLPFTLPCFSLSLSSPLCSRFCHPSFDLCSFTLFHYHSPFSSLAICFRGIANIWNLGNATFQKPRNEAKLARKESAFCVRCGYYCVDLFTRLTEPEGAPPAIIVFPI